MDRWRRWRPRRPAGGARRAGVKALGVLVVTAALAVLLAVLFHLAWPPVVVAILGTVPALYLAWAALPGAISPPGPGAADKPVYGRHVEQWDPVELGVHQVIGGGPMPAYIRRPHDELLRAVLDPAVPASRLVVVRGGSSTARPAPPIRRSRTGWRAGSWTTRWTPARWRRVWRPGSLPARCCGWASCASTPTPTAARRCWAAWPTCSKVRAAWSSPPCGPSSGPPTPPRPAPVPEPPTRPGWPGGCSSGCPSWPAATRPGSIRPAAGSSTSRTGSPPPTWKPRPGPAIRCWQKRPRRPRAPGTTGRSPSIWPGSRTCWTVMKGPAATLTARRSSPRRWTPCGSATPARCPPRSSRKLRSGT